MINADDKYYVLTDYIDGLAIGDEIIICPSEDLFARKGNPDGIKFDTDIIKRNPMWFEKSEEEWVLETYGVRIGGVKEENSIKMGHLRISLEKDPYKIKLPSIVSKEKAQKILKILNE